MQSAANGHLRQGQAPQCGNQSVVLTADCKQQIAMTANCYPSAQIAMFCDCYGASVAVNYELKQYFTNATVGLM